MADRGLIDELVAGGVFDRDSAEEMASRVLAAIAARVAAGRSVWIEGVGRLGGKTKWRDTYSAGLARVQVRVAHLSSPVELSRGEPQSKVKP